MGGRFEARSYGFRPGRGCHDAIESLFNTLAGRGTRVWILDADLAGAFDAIDHDHLLEALGRFPARAMIAGWLTAGMVEAGVGFTPTTEGVPQGGVISPLILNIALHGLEEAAGVRYRGGIHADDVVPRQPGGDQVRRRPGRLLHNQAAGRAGQGEADRVAGTEGPCVQRGQDPDRAPQ
jgi:RNA-directed DNA polymerase